MLMLTCSMFSPMRFARSPPHYSRFTMHPHVTVNVSLHALHNAYLLNVLSDAVCQVPTAPTVPTLAALGFGCWRFLPVVLQHEHMGVARLELRVKILEDMCAGTHCAELENAAH